MQNQCRDVFRTVSTSFRSVAGNTLHSYNICIYIYIYIYTGLFKMIVGVLTTCHTQYTWDRSVCFFLFNRTTLQVFVTYLTGALYVHPLWFYKHQHACPVYCVWQVIKTPTIISNNPVESQRCTYRAPVRYVTKTWSVVLWNKKIHILLSQVYCVWQVVKTMTIISNNPVYVCVCMYI